MKDQNWGKHNSLLRQILSKDKQIDPLWFHICQGLVHTTTDRVDIWPLQISNLYVS